MGVWVYGCDGCDVVAYKHLNHVCNPNLRQPTILSKKPRARIPPSVRCVGGIANTDEKSNVKVQKYLLDPRLKTVRQIHELIARENTSHTTLGVFFQAAFILQTLTKDRILQVGPQIVAYALPTVETLVKHAMVGGGGGGGRGCILCICLSLIVLALRYWHDLFPVRAGAWCHA
jgi:hypothetical protein